MILKTEGNRITKLNNFFTNLIFIIMKQIFTFLTIMMFAFTINAQYIYNDFDANQNETFSGWPNMPTIVANPDVSGINTSAHVAEWVRGEEQWAHVYCEIDGTIDFSTGTVFAVKAHLPIACDVLFKLEGGNGEVTELLTSVTTVNEWTQLNFDFVDGQSGIYNKIVIFFDFSSLANNTFYFDDVTGPEYQSGGTGDPVDLPVTFDDDNVNYGLTDFGGNVSEIIVDPTDPDNKVAQSIKTETAELWAGTTVGGTVGFANPIPFVEGSTIMTVDVWSPQAGIPIRLKVEDAGDPTISVETEATITAAMAWETLSFDFSNEATGTAPINFANTYNKASIFFNFGTTGAQAGEQTFYWDNIFFGSPTSIVESSTESISIYPNPATEVINILSSQKLNEVSIYSVNGQLMYNSENTSVIDVSNYTSGLYIVSVTYENGAQTKLKFMIK